MDDQPDKPITRHELEQALKVLVETIRPRTVSAFSVKPINPPAKTKKPIQWDVWMYYALIMGSGLLAGYVFFF